ncbi:MAG: hypothetical protein ACOCQL_06505 [Halolamina sp.]
MRRPSRAVLAGGATTVLWIGGVLLTHASGTSSIIEALNTLEQVSGLLLTAGVPGGLVTGVLADEYAPLMKEGFVASVGGAATVVVAVGLYGIGLSIVLGYGADSVLSFMFTGPSMFTFFLLLPLLAMEGVVFALLANAVWGRLRQGAVA